MAVDHGEQSCLGETRVRGDRLEGLRVAVAGERVADRVRQVAAQGDQHARGRVGRRGEAGDLGGRGRGDARERRGAGRITELRAGRSQGTAHTTAAKLAESEAAEGEQQPAPVESPIEWLRINAKQHAARILQTVKLRAFNPRAVEWQRMHAVAAVFHLQHGHLDLTDKTKHAELISWLTRQRHLYGQGLLDAARVSELDALGMIWSKNANAWERGAAYAAAFHHQHGHLAIPATAKLDDYAVGAWMRRQRKADNLTTDQVAKLDALDELWRLEPDWNRSYRRLLAYLAAGGTLDGPANRTGLGDDPAFRPGTWLRKQDKARADGKLTNHQTALLDALYRHAETVTG